jgi:4-amino-4-deoxy-L-arabinose transferase-like glycosyltransferase
MYVSLALFWTKFSRAEVFFAECAREMVLYHNPITPLFHHHPFFDKPILVYWLIIGCYKLFGISHLTARIPSILAALVSVTVCSISTTAMFRNRQAGLVAGMALASSFMFFSFAYLCMSDMLLTALDTITMALLYVGIVKPNYRTSAWWLAAAGMGFAFATKGPVGVALPAISFLLFLGLKKELHIIRPKHLLLGVVTVALIAAPWFIAAYQANGSGAIGYFFIRENFQRFAGSTYDTHKPIWFMVQSLMTGFLPWSIFLPIILWVTASNLKEKRTSEYWSGELYLWLWIAVVIGFFSVSRGKCDYYALPAYPAAAALVGLYLTNWINSNSKITKSIAYLLSIVFLGTAFGLTFFLPKVVNSAIFLSWCYLPAVLLIASLIIVLMAQKNKIFAAYTTVFVGICLSGTAFAAQIFPQIIRQQPIKDYVSTIRSLPPQTKIGVDSSLAPWIDQITFESAREPVCINDSNQLKLFMTAKEPVIVIVPEPQFEETFGTHSKFKILDRRKAISHALNPGYVFNQGGKMYDSTILLVGN